MKSFKSFEQILASQKLPDEWLSNHSSYWAHIHPERDPEPLLDHIRLVNDYALRLIRVHGLDTVVDKLIEDLLKQADVRQEAGNYLKLLFLSTIVFHDFGKINPNFQAKRMNNDAFKIDKSIKIDSQHSRLSAYLYLSHHLDAIDQNANFSDDEGVMLKTIAFLLADSIFLHHSGTFYHDVKLDDQLIPSLKRFLELMQPGIDQEAQILDHKGVIRYFREEWNPLEDHFPVFALLKLNFSLLTASDYLATSHFMLKLPVTDFGLMDETFKKEFKSNFYSTKEYNTELSEYSRFEFYKKLPFENLQESSRKNLNLLRQKLTVEVLSNIRENSQNRLFYLEAPTGAGKTNLSLAIALELLETNPELNTIFYVFPFTTLITQTFRGIQEAAGLSNSQLIQLHSKAGFHQKNEENEDGLYGNEKMNFIDNLFIHYPVSLLTHIRFFDILKSNDKESNYILHRLSNSVVIIDELQSYNPRHWDKIIFFLSKYARFFNIRFVLMSATLPYIDEVLDKDSPMKGKVVKLVHNKDAYFLNPNFGSRVQFDFTLLNEWKKPLGNEAREEYLDKLKTFVLGKSEERAKSYEGKSRIIVEFVKKKSAAEFFRLVSEDSQFEGYRIFLISGEILEPRRREIIAAIKGENSKKILLITTQVVEAGVDIDMDLGFKDKSIADSDEQLAGRVNRNASKKCCIVYIFDFDNKENIYGKDERYKMRIDSETHQRILQTKDFQELYNKVKAKINDRNDNPYLIENLPSYLGHFERFDFRKINHEFRLIEEGGLSVFVPISIPARHFTENETVLTMFNILPDNDGNISGKEIWDKYEAIVRQNKEARENFVDNQIILKQIGELMSKFVFSFFVAPGQQIHALSAHGEDRLGYFLLTHWDSNGGIYTYIGGLDMNKINSDVFL